MADTRIMTAEWFEVHKPGYMKRFVYCDAPEDAINLGHIVHQCGATLQRVTLRKGVEFPHMHYVLPDDAAQATLELIAYYTAPHSEGDHMRGRLTDL